VSQSIQEQVTLAWNSVLSRPPEWAFSAEGQMFDHISKIGISYDPVSRKFAVGHITADLKFLPAMGPFDTIVETTITLIGAVANHDAAAYHRR
jgi:hypothetical protein